jgi:hypothetical protein
MCTVQTSCRSMRKKATLWRTCDKAGAPSFYVQLNFWFITSQLLRGGQIVKNLV